MNEYVELRDGETLSGYTLHILDYDEYDNVMQYKVNNGKVVETSGGRAYREEGNPKQLNFKTIKKINNEVIAIVYLSDWK